jgi:hypothetical protein
MNLPVAEPSYATAITPTLLMFIVPLYRFVPIAGAQPRGSIARSILITI